MVWGETGGPSPSLKDVQRSHSFGSCASLEPTGTCFPDDYMEAEHNAPQTLKGRAAARGWRPEHILEGWKPVCAAGLRADRIWGTSARSFDAGTHEWENFSLG